MADEDLWLGLGGHPDLAPPEVDDSPGATAWFPLSDACDSAPLDSHFVAAVAWSFAPGRERREGYFIEPSPVPRYAWVLWDFAYDDDREAWSWRARAATNAAIRSPREAARHLLEKAWEWDRRYQRTARFDEVDEAGIIDCAEVDHIADRVWRNPV